ncbi:MAG: thrombospondin type 3 repeat-containing protein, partial [Bacteroidia bacterium]|nr:thrombospondin type 3 repeat-containing protein [Bacteroidia bacterium]
MINSQTYQRSFRWISRSFLAFFLLVAGITGIQAQISFLSDELVTGLSSPTTLQVGPDGRLYVGQQNGTINIYTVVRSSPGNYSITDTEELLLVKNIINHNDNGTDNLGQGNRQVTGLVVIGTANNPILIVSSSDPRIAVGNDSNLDTNSGIITKLTWIGADLNDPAGYWDRVHLVRGLTRSEENHATNGMSLDATNNMLYMAVGGHTNKGAPGNNFSGTPEYALSAAVLQIDLDAIAAMPVYTDLRSGEKFVYDIPTLDDPTRSNITNADANFPYAPGHPYYNQSIDPGDPFGGNNGLNMARWVVGGPVQVFGGGFRNPYDVVYTSLGRVYTFDNGPNGGWGGVPKTYNASGLEIDYSTFNPALGHYVTNEMNEGNSTQHGDGLHYVTPGSYAGHPNPTRAFPDKAPLIVYEKTGGNWTATGTYDFFTDFPEPPVPMSLANPAEGQYLHPSVIAMADINASTNGLCEYTASNFGGALQGNLLVASFNDNIISFKLSADGASVVTQSNLLSGNGDNPLDVWAQGDGVEFPGTIWVAFHGANKIMVFEPNDYAPFNCTGAYDIGLDEDGDGYTNADEIDNGTDPCNQGDKPADYDGDFLSNLNDDDDDNDGLLDTYDPFAVDANNGMST